jgi:hypothetical protein
MIVTGLRPCLFDGMLIRFQEGILYLYVRILLAAERKTDIVHKCGGKDCLAVRIFSGSRQPNMAFSVRPIIFVHTLK